MLSIHHPQYRWRITWSNGDTWNGVAHEAPVAQRCIKDVIGLYPERTVTSWAIYNHKGTCIVAMDKF